MVEFVEANFGTPDEKSLLSDWPTPSPLIGFEVVNEQQAKQDLQALRNSTCRGAPFGSLSWVEQIIKRMGLESTLGPQGRPPKKP